MTVRSRLADVGALRFAMRAKVLWRDREMARLRPADARHFLFHSTEVANFTYELANEDAIPAFLSSVLRADEAETAGYLDELRDDEELLGSLRTRLDGVARRDPDPRLGKRRLQYCIVRAEKPEVVVESGVHDGLGSAVLLRALERNSAEGSPGRLIGLDINPDAGWLVDRERHGDRFEFVAGDTKATLPVVLGRAGEVGFFIHDSLKTHEHETFELEQAARARGVRQVLWVDDTSATGAMREFAAREGGSFAVFAEEPLRHYWRGNPLGVVVLR